MTKFDKYSRRERLDGGWESGTGRKYRGRRKEHSIKGKGYMEVEGETKKK